MRLDGVVQIATSYPAGPVYLTISRDVLMDPPALYASRTAGFAVPSGPAVPGEQLQEVADLIASVQAALAHHVSGRTHGVQGLRRSRGYRVVDPA